MSRAHFRSIVKSYDDAERFFGGEHEREIAHNTVVQRRPLHDMRALGTIAVTYHCTDVVTFVRYADGESVVLDTGGYDTVTTRHRISACLPLGWTLLRYRGESFICTTPAHSRDAASHDHAADVLLRDGLALDV